MLVLPGDLTRTQANACLKMLLQGLQAEPGPASWWTLRPLGRFDSAALAVLLECRREAQQMGKDITIRAMPERCATSPGCMESPSCCLPPDSNG